MDNREVFIAGMAIGIGIGLIACILIFVLYKELKEDPELKELIEESEEMSSGFSD